MSDSIIYHTGGARVVVASSFRLRGELSFSERFETFDRVLEDILITLQN